MDEFGTINEAMGQYFQSNLQLGETVWGKLASQKI